MTRPRATLVSVADTPYHHVIGRCVRPAYLCGDDALTGRSFSHRRQGLLERLRLLTDTFAIDLCAYALMSNHYHLVVRIDAARIKQWSAHEIVTRWRRLYAGSAAAQKCLKGEALSAMEQAQLDHWLPVWSARLADLSWFMRCLNEWLARLANQEDGCTGRFWEGRFKSQALLDEGAVLTALAYVDLNPVRAGMATTAEWFRTVTQLQARFELFVGAPHRLRTVAAARGWRWVCGLAAGRRLYARANR